MQRLFDEAESAGLHPTWREDYAAFSYVCPYCEGEGRRELVAVDHGAEARRFDPPIP